MITSQSPTLQREQIRSHLGVERIDLIKENDYCFIYLARTGEEKMIVKHYKGDDPTLAGAEARAVDFYHNLCRTEPGLIDSRTLRFEPDQNLLCIQFVPGECVSQLVYRSRRDAVARKQLLEVMGTLGRLLARVARETARPGEKTDPFIFEYIRHTSRRLRSLPLLGWTWFRESPAEAERLIEALEGARFSPTLIHGDFVFRNMHFHEGRVGLIDFANTGTHSHTYNDVFNLRVALSSMFLPRRLEEEILETFRDGLGQLDCPPVVADFYREYHLRRWLALKLHAARPGAWAQAYRAVRALSRNASPGRFP